MALFGSSAKKSNTQKAVKRTVVRTHNVVNELFKVAKSYDVAIESLDFKLLEVQTFSRMYDGKRETDWEEIKDEKLYEIDDQSALLNPFFQLKQIYEIEIFSASQELNPVCPNLKLAVGANATKCKIYLSISKGSILKDAPELDEKLTNYINKRKIRAGIFIGIFDEMLKDLVSKITAQVRVEEKIVYDKPETLLIAEGLEPTQTTDDKIILHFQDTDEIDESERIDYAARGFIKNVKEDELLIEYVKPKPGVSGRNCRGEFMQPTEPIVENEVTFNVDSTISVHETDDAIEYRANENGYIAFEDNTYLIKTDMDVGEISFKTTGSIKTGLDSDVSLSVKETDAVKDAIGTGMNVEVSEIDIDGNVGSHARVVALRASIGGQTHKDATITADELDINVHKGKAYGKNIKITRLEHGYVDANNVNIVQALGGIIHAREAYIDLCASHVKVSATKRIEIQKMQGSENIFTIDPVLNKTTQEDLGSNKETIHKLKQEIHDLKKEIEKYTDLVTKGMKSFMEIKKKLIHYKKNGVKLPGAFVKKYKEFTRMQEHLKELKGECEIKKDQLALQESKTSSFQDCIFDARVINRDRWVGYNEIRFKLVDPPQELVYKPQEGSFDSVFGLVESDNGEFSIEVISE